MIILFYNWPPIKRKYSFFSDGRCHSVWPVTSDCKARRHGPKKSRRRVRPTLVIKSLSQIPDIVTGQNWIRYKVCAIFFVTRKKDIRVLARSECH